MYQQVASRQAIVSTTSAEAFGRAIAMSGWSSVQIEVVSFVMSADDIVVTLEASNDLENWSDTGVNVQLLEPGYGVSEVVPVGAAYVRTKCTLSGVGTSISSLGMNLSVQ